MRYRLIALDLEAFCRLQAIPREAVIAMGDGEADRSMMEWAGTGVVMGWAPDKGSCDPKRRPQPYVNEAPPDPDGKDATAMDDATPWLPAPVEFDALGITREPDPLGTQPRGPKVTGSAG